mmetsp:Transcript_102488/g.290238  ORF Transcript_102488/g.290238 Transcript_102488/m.290238 type:complete len:317 (-) Transcript_102488:28-978(-)
MDQQVLPDPVACRRAPQRRARLQQGPAARRPLQQHPGEQLRVGCRGRRGAGVAAVAANGLKQEEAVHAGGGLDRPVQRRAELRGGGAARVQPQVAQDLPRRRPLHLVHPEHGLLPGVLDRPRGRRRPELGLGQRDGVRDDAGAPREEPPQLPDDAGVLAHVHRVQVHDRGAEGLDVHVLSGVADEAHPALQRFRQRLPPKLRRPVQERVLLNADAFAVGLLHDAQQEVALPAADVEEDVVGADVRQSQQLRQVRRVRLHVLPEAQARLGRPPPRLRRHHLRLDVICSGRAGAALAARASCPLPGQGAHPPSSASGP